MNKKLERNVLVRLEQQRPHLPPAVQVELAGQLLALPSELQENLTQWANGQALSTVRIWEKYAVEDVLSIRRDGDVISALLDLGAYAWDEAKEYRLWRVRA